MVETHHRRDDEDDYSRKSERGWHLVREIPITMVFMFLVQTCGIIWWGAVWSTGLSRDVQTQAQQQSYMRGDISDMRNDIKDLKTTISSNNAPAAVNAARLESLSQQVTTLWAQVDAIRQQLRK